MAKGAHARMAVCLSEDRPLEEFSLRLALCSLRRHWPGTTVFVYRADATDAFRGWIARGFPDVTLIPSAPAGAWSWNCKPHALWEVLDRGFAPVVWLDSDIMVTRACDDLFLNDAAECLGIAEEPASAALQGSERRTLGWGLPVGRTLQRTLNSCVLRVTEHHRALLQRWAELLARPDYRHSATLPFDQRPLHLLGDQDVLNALLGSSEFASVPLRLMRTGREVIHSGGALAYSLGERLRGLARSKPALIHGQGTKLWWAFDRDSLDANTSGWWFMRRLLLEISPYFAEAKRYRAELELPAPWMDYGSVLGRMLNAIGCGHFALRGLPVTAAATLFSALQQWRRPGHP